MFASARSPYALVLILSAVLLHGVIASPCLVTAAERPNVVLIMTDDQGYGDLGVHGNPKLETPNLDRLARDSVRFESFYVCPVCSPTRASLMTGRYNYRTGVVDTYLGRSMMHTDEVTLAEMLRSAGYRTGIFGKWHLGDNYPLRPMDQGFDTSLVHRGGGISQPSDPPGNSYFDPILLENGRDVQTEGYCSDVFTSAAINFIKEAGDEPFFVYLPYNCPHSPLQVPEEDYRRYREMNLAHKEFPDFGQPLPGKADQEKTARVYGMVDNIDWNVGRLFSALDEGGVRENTIVIFLTDNGPQHPRYNAGMRGRKGSVYEGGIRVPFFFCWPAKLAPGMVDRIAAHIDVAPTLLAACDVVKPENVAFDGVNLMPLLEDASTACPDRHLFFQWHRGDEPQRYRACAVRTQHYKLVQPQGGGNRPLPESAAFELYDMREDPFEMRNIADERSDVVAKMRKAYDQWFDDVSSTRGYDPPRIFVGTPHENPVVLTPQDWRGPRAGWGPKDLGYWEIHVARAGRYRVTFRFDETPEAATVRLKVGQREWEEMAAAGASEVVFDDVELTEGDARLEAEVQRDSETVGVNYVDVDGPL